MERGRGSLFEGLPPPAAHPPSLPSPADLPSSPSPASASIKAGVAASVKSKPDVPPGIRLPAAPALRSALTPSKREAEKTDDGSKRVRFKSNEVEASDEQILAAIGKIASHISNPAKFAKASKLAVQLLQAGSVKQNIVDSFYEILKASMAVPSRATDAELWQDYQALFGAVLSQREVFGAAQQAQLNVWEMWAILANEFRTDDTFTFSKASSRVRQLVDSLPEFKSEDKLDLQEVEGVNLLQSGVKPLNERGDTSNLSTEGSERDVKSDADESKVENDPFGLNALMPRLSKKEERARRKKDEEAASVQIHEDIARLLYEQREALVCCLKMAVDRYKFPWAQTIIDMLVKHVFDSSSKFTTSQKQVITQLWGSIREQLLSRKYNRPASGKLDATPFERLQSHYAQEHISIRRAVGSSGERSAEQWLG